MFLMFFLYQSMYMYCTYVFCSGYQIDGGSCQIYGLSIENHEFGEGMCVVSKFS